MTQTSSLWLLIVLLGFANGCIAEAESTEDVGEAADAILNCTPTHPDYPDCPNYPTTPSQPPKRPDLVPVLEVANDGTCYTRGEWILMKVKNNGTASASASQLYIRFSSQYWGQAYLVPALAAGASANVYTNPLGYDPNCYYQQCTMSVTADYGSVVTESNEGNNGASIRCDYYFRP